jgi:hypothetical protein
MPAYIAPGSPNPCGTARERLCQPVRAKVSMGTPPSADVGAVPVAGPWFQRDLRVSPVF